MSIKITINYSISFKNSFHIVGSGSAGAVVASRLSEVENWNVLLLEAGGDETEISDVPLMAGYLQLSKMDWQYKTEPSGTFCLGEIKIRNIITLGIFSLVISHKKI